MRDIIDDCKIIMIILIGSVIYSLILCDSINFIEIGNMLLVVTFSVCVSTIIFSYNFEKKYLNNLYEYLSIAFFGIGVVSISYIYIVKTGTVQESFWIYAGNFNMSFSIFESLIILYCFIKKNEPINFLRFLGVVLVLSCCTVYIGAHFEKCVTLFFDHKFYLNICNYFMITATIIKAFVLYYVVSIKDEIPERLYKNLFTFLVSRILLHLFGIANLDYITDLTVLLSCLVLITGNYSMVKIMIIDIIKVPQDKLCKDLSEKTKNLEDTVLKMKEITDEKEIISNNYSIKEKQEQLRNNTIINLSHEFKTPINVIYAAIQTQELSKNNGNSVESTQYNKIIKQNCNRLIRLINNFIDITSLENGILETNFEYVNIVEVTENIVVEVREFIKNKKINIIFDTEEEEIYTYVDKILYRRALLNILSNSIKYTNIESDVKVKISLESEGIGINISDKGIGIEEDNLISVFNRFERIDKTFSRDTEGCGLGLNLVKEIIKLFKGRLRICSIKGVGTSMQIRLPRYNISEEERLHIISDISEEDSIKHEVEVEMSDIYFN